MDLKYQESSLLLAGSSGGLQVSSNSWTAFDRTLMRSSWRSGGPELSDRLSDHLIGLPSHPILSLQGRNGHGVIPLFLAKGHKLLDVSRRAEAVFGEGNRGMGRALGLVERQDDGRRKASPRIGREPYCSGPRALSTVGLIQRRLSMGQAQAGDAVIVLIQHFYCSCADLVNCSHNEFNR